MNQICKTEPVKLNESISLNQYEDIHSKEYFTKIVQNNSCRADQKSNIKAQNTFDQLCKETKLKILATDKLDLQQQITSKIQHMKSQIQDQHKKNLNSKVYSILYGTLSSQEGTKTASSTKKEFKQNDYQSNFDNKINKFSSKNGNLNQKQSETDTITKKKLPEQVHLPVIQSRSQIFIQKLLEKQNRTQRSVSYNVNGYNQSSENSNNNSKNFQLSQQQIQQQYQVGPASQRLINPLIDKQNQIIFNDKKLVSDISNSMYLENQMSTQNIKDNNITQIEQTTNKNVELVLSQKDEYQIDQLSYQRNSQNRKPLNKKAQYNAQMNPHKNQRNSQCVIKLRSLTQAVDQIVKEVPRSLHKSQEQIEDENIINLQNNNLKRESSSYKNQHLNINNSVSDQNQRDTQVQSPNQSQIIQFEFPQTYTREKILSPFESRSGSTPLKSTSNKKRVILQQQNQTTPIENEVKRETQKNEKGRAISPFCLFPVLINEQNKGVGNNIDDVCPNKNSVKNQNKMQIFKSSDQIAFKDSQSPKQRGTPISRKNKILSNENNRSPKDKTCVSPSYVLGNMQNLRIELTSQNLNNLKLSQQMSQSSIDSSEVYNFDGIQTKQIPQKYESKIIQNQEYNKYFSNNSERPHLRWNQAKGREIIDNPSNFQPNLDSEKNIDQEKISSQNNTQKKTANQVVYSSLRKSNSQQRLPRKQLDFKKLDSEDKSVKKIKLIIKESSKNLNSDQQSINNKTNEISSTKNKNVDQFKYRSENNLPSPNKQKPQQQIVSSTQEELLKQQQKYNIRSIPIIQNIKNPSDKSDKLKVNLKNDILQKLINQQSPSNQQHNPLQSAQSIEFNQSKKPSLASQAKEDQSYRLEKYFKDKYQHQYNNVSPEKPEKRVEKKKISKELKRKKQDFNEQEDFANLDPWEIELCQDNYIFTYQQHDLGNGHEGDGVDE